MLVCDTRDRAITYMLCRITSNVFWLFLKEGEVCSKFSLFKQNLYCHSCHTTFAVFFALPSCCVSSL